MDKKTGIFLVIGLFVSALLLFPVSTVFISLLLILLFIPPSVVAGYVLAEGGSVLYREISEKEKDTMIYTGITG